MLVKFLGFCSDYSWWFNYPPDVQVFYLLLLCYFLHERKMSYNLSLWFNFLLRRKGDVWWHSLSSSWNVYMFNYLMVTSCLLQTWCSLDGVEHGLWPPGVHDLHGRGSHWFYHSPFLICLFIICFLLVLLKYNWRTALCQLKAFSLMVWLNGHHEIIIATWGNIYHLIQRQK